MNLAHLIDKISECLIYAAEHKIPLKNIHIKVVSMGGTRTHEVSGVVFEPEGEGEGEQIKMVIDVD